MLNEENEMLEFQTNQKLRWKFLTNKNEDSYKYQAPILLRLGDKSDEQNLTAHSLDSRKWLIFEGFAICDKRMDL